ncbi:MAG TPA: ABC transporter ATP-binding protein [Bacillota bacterium]|nr:ABC transporter ATP-binding protein [Bacillota bacterium]
MIRLVGVSKYYMTGSVSLAALDNVSLEVTQGELLAIIGPSGSGKSTLMNMIGLLDVPSQGQYFLEGVEVSQLAEDRLAEIRNSTLGFVFQSFNLLPKLTALENVELPLIYRGMNGTARRAAAMEALDRVGLSNRVTHRPSELSGGQQQRVAIARALAGDPPVILADEPTGNLDSKSGAEVMQLIKKLHRDGKSVILITHDNDIAGEANRVIRMQDGKIIQDGEMS